MVSAALAICAVLVSAGGSGSYPSDGPRRAAVVSVSPDGREWSVRVPTGATPDSGSGLLACDASNALIWGDFRSSSDGVASYVVRDDARSTTRPVRGEGNAAAPGDWQAWIVPGELCGLSPSDLPPEATLFAPVQSVGPAMRSVWLTISPVWGIRVGDAWWMRLAGQPVARLETRLVDGTRAFCVVHPLVAELTIAAGDRAALWPGPGDQRREIIRSAVGFVEDRPEGQILWLAAPTGIGAPAEARCEISHDGRLIAHAVVESRDERFWYARRMFSIASERVRVGDEALIRSNRDLSERRVASRVFDVNQEGCLVNLGEIDGLAVGAECEVWRDGRKVADAAIVRLQREYSVLRPREATAAIQVGDDVWPHRRTAPPATVELGRIVRSAGPAFVAQTTSSTAAKFVGSPLSIRRNGTLIGVAVLVSAGPGVCLGAAVEASLAEPLSPGAALFGDVDGGGR